MKLIGFILGLIFLPFALMGVARKMNAWFA